MFNVTTISEYYHFLSAWKIDSPAVGVPEGNLSIHMHMYTENYYRNLNQKSNGISYQGIFSEPE